jgi:hypothetical protein
MGFLRLIEARWKSVRVKMTWKYVRLGLVRDGHRDLFTPERLSILSWTTT